MHDGEGQGGGALLQQNAEAFVDQMFKVDDKDGNGFLDFLVTLKYWNTDAFLSFSGVYAFVRFNGFCNSLRKVEVDR